LALIRAFLIFHFGSALQSLRIIVRREDFSSPHELGSPGDMQTFASGEAKICHQFGNLKPQTRSSRPSPSCGVEKRKCLVAATPRWALALKTAALFH
jgi:hypothetical protein